MHGSIRRWKDVHKRVSIQDAVNFKLMGDGATLDWVAFGTASVRKKTSERHSAMLLQLFPVLK